MSFDFYHIVHNFWVFIFCSHSTVPLADSDSVLCKPMLSTSPQLASYRPVENPYALGFTYAKKQDLVLDEHTHTLSLSVLEASQKLHHRPELVHNLKINLDHDLASASSISLKVLSVSK